MEKLNHIQKELKILNNLINKDNWKGTNYPSKIDD